jgi:hypothetical protein
MPRAQSYTHGGKANKSQDPSTESANHKRHVVRETRKVEAHHNHGESELGGDNNCGSDNQVRTYASCAGHQKKSIGQHYRGSHDESAKDSDDRYLNSGHRANECRWFVCHNPEKPQGGSDQDVERRQHPLRGGS